MASFNKVILMGNLTKDPANKQTQGGTSVCSFTLAVSRKFTSNGQQQDEVCYVDITAFGKTAEICGQYLAKGSPALIDGRLKLDQWEDKQTGEKRSKLSVLAETVQLMGGRKEDNGNRNDNGNYGGYQQQQPQSRGNGNYAPPPMPTEPVYAEDDMAEIPF